MPSYPLLCLAAQYSQRVYTKPSGKEREAHVDANWKMGTKAMVIKSVPVDDMNTIVFAIRGSQTFMDWAVNLNSAPVSPGDFLVSTTFCPALSHQLVNPIFCTIFFYLLLPRDCRHFTSPTWAELPTSRKRESITQFYCSPKYPFSLYVLAHSPSLFRSGYRRFNPQKTPKLTTQPRTTPATSATPASSPSRAV